MQNDPWTDLLIAADIMLTVIKPSLEEVSVLPVVGIRTVLTLSLIKEAKDLDKLDEQMESRGKPPLTRF